MCTAFQTRLRAIRPNQQPTQGQAIQAMVSYVELEKTLWKFWVTEEPHGQFRARKLKPHIQKTNRFATDEFSVRLPFKSDVNPSIELGDSQRIAYIRLIQLERRLAQDPGPDKQ